MNTDCPLANLGKGFSLMAAAIAAMKVDGGRIVNGADPVGAFVGVGPRAMTYHGVSLSGGPDADAIVLEEGEAALLVRVSPDGYYPWDCWARGPSKEAAVGAALRWATARPRFDAWWHLATRVNALLA